MVYRPCQRISFAYFSKIVSCDDFSSRPDSNSRRIVRTIVSNDDETITVG